MQLKLGETTRWRGEFPGARVYDPQPVRNCGGV